ncbi:MAG: ethylbenzene dehydrogenase-related protein [Motiliproteus sp.]
MILRILSSLLLMVFCSFQPLSAQTVDVIQLSVPPTLDGQDLEWENHPGVRIQLHQNGADSVVEATDILVKAGRFNDEVLFYLEWNDNIADEVHKPYIWSEQRGKYVRGPQREDRLAMQFEVSGAFDADWLSSPGFIADMWHWKAARSNPLGLAHDKKTTLSINKLLRAARIASPEGQVVYVLRQDDAGSPLYRSLRYAQKEQPQMPKYELQPQSNGSIADVRARGLWKEGKWHLELLRKMNTGNDDDVVFIRGRAVKGAIAVFDRSENHDHKTSVTLNFQF